MHSYWYLLIPLFLTVIAFYNLYDEVLNRYLHKRGTLGEATILRVKRSIPKDRGRLMSLDKRDHAATYDARCDYILDVSYTRADGEVVRIRDCIVPATIRVSGGILFPLLKEGQTAPVRYCRFPKKHIVFQREDTNKQQTKLFDLLLWSLCALVAVVVLISMLVTA